MFVVPLRPAEAAPLATLGKPATPKPAPAAARATNRTHRIWRHRVVPDRG